MPSLSIVTLTRNEEKHIREFIEAAKLCEPAEMIMIDDGSTDSTVTIAESYGVKVYRRALDGDFGQQVNFGIDKASADYVFYLESDEFVAPELAESIKKVVQESKQEVYNVVRKNIVFGEKMTHGAFRPDTVARIYPRGKATWPGIIHLQLKHSLPTVTLSGNVWHYTYKTWKQYWRKFDIYTTIGAEQDYQRGKRATKINSLLHAGGGFFKMFVLKKGFLDGYMGWVMCCNHFAYTLAKYNKLMMIQQEKTKK